MLFDCAEKALRKLNSDLLSDLAALNRTSLEHLLEVLKVLEVASKTFSRLDCNLLTAEKTLKFVQSKLSQMRTSFSLRMARTIDDRFEERRSFLAHILVYLETGTLNVISEQDVVHYTERLVRRLYKFDLNESELASDPSSTSIASEASSINLEAELNSYLKASPVIIENSSDLQKLLKGEIKSFKQTGQRGKFLEFTHNQAKEIRVSSVDVERVFSSLGLMITKFRSRLSDEAIDDYLFLKHYFRNLEVYKVDFKDFF